MGGRTAGVATCSARPGRCSGPKPASSPVAHTAARRPPPGRGAPAPSATSVWSLPTGAPAPPRPALGGGEGPPPGGAAQGPPVEAGAGDEIGRGAEGPPPLLPLQHLPGGPPQALHLLEAEADGQGAGADPWGRLQRALPGGA